MRHLLFIAHRVPFPPNKGDRIRNFHVIRALSRHFKVHVVAFAEPDEPQWAPPGLLEVCESATVVPLPSGRTRSLLKALLSGHSVSEAHYSRWPMVCRIVELVGRHKIDLFWAGSSALAPYLLKLPGRRYIDFMDVDSDKWRQYAERSGNPLARWIYRRESRRVAALEARAIQGTDATFVVAEGERTLLLERLGNDAPVITAGNGVTPVNDFGPPMADRPEQVVFTGAMDYWPNEDAVIWFADKVWPTVLADRPDARFVIVGANPTRAVDALAERAGIEVTGTVPEVAPYLASSRLMVAPLRMARGIQNKVLEGMAAGLPVVTTPEGADGIHAMDGEHFVVRADPDRTAEEVIRLLADPQAGVALGARARELIHTVYTWESQLTPLLDEVLKAAPEDPAPLVESAG